MTRQLAVAKFAVVLLVGCPGCERATSGRIEDRNARTASEGRLAGLERRELVARLVEMERELERRQEETVRLHEAVRGLQRAVEAGKRDLRESEERRLRQEKELALTQKRLAKVVCEFVEHNREIRKLLEPYGVIIDHSVQPIRGKVLAVRPEDSVVMLSVGADGGVEKDFRFIVFRGDQYIGTVQVEELFADRASARILKDWEKGTIKVNDAAETPPPYIEPGNLGGESGDMILNYEKGIELDPGSDEPGGE